MEKPFRNKCDKQWNYALLEVPLFSFCEGCLLSGKAAMDRFRFLKWGGGGSSCYHLSFTVVCVLKPTHPNFFSPEEIKDAGIGTQLCCSTPLLTDGSLNYTTCMILHTKNVLPHRKLGASKKRRLSIPFCHPVFYVGRWWWLRTCNHKSPTQVQSGTAPIQD